jgi:catechol 2,3-dioxygenase-like lactoylglutathione lyase family enzyme
VTGVAGVTVAVQDLATSVARYRALLGREPVVVGGVPGLGFGLAQFRIGRQTLSLAEPRGPAVASLGEHLVRRGQGTYAISFYGADDARLDDGLTHGARLEIIRDL